MAWQEVETDIGLKVGRCTWSVSMKHGGARISLPEAVAAELRWTPSTMFKLQVGAAEMLGSFRLVADAQGKMTGRSPPKGKGLMIRLGRWPGMAPRDVDKIAIDHEVQTGALVFRLPSHALNVAPAPRIERALPASSNGGGKTDVTDKFFNDPKRPVAMAAGTRGGR